MLADFLEELKDRGFKISPKTYIDVQDILFKLSQAPTHRLRSTLGPIICTNASEQELFDELFDRHFAHRSISEFLPPTEGLFEQQATPQHIDQPQDDPEKDTSDEPHLPADGSGSFLFSMRLRSIVAIVFVAVLISFGLWTALTLSTPEQTLPGPKTDSLTAIPKDPILPQTDPDPPEIREDPSDEPEEKAPSQPKPADQGSDEPPSNLTPGVDRPEAVADDTRDPTGEADDTRSSIILDILTLADIDLPTERYSIDQYRYTLNFLQRYNFEILTALFFVMVVMVLVVFRIIPKAIIHGNWAVRSLSTPPFWFPIRVPAEKIQFLDDLQVKSTARTLHGKVISSLRPRFAVKESINKTISSGGFFQVVHRPNTKDPTYVVMVQNRSGRSLLSPFVKTMITKLSDRHVQFAYYEYQEDLSTIFDPETLDTLDITDFQSRHINGRLLVIGSTESIMASPREIELLGTTYPQLLILNPKPGHLWSVADHELAKSLPLLPLSLASLEEIIRPQFTPPAFRSRLEDQHHFDRLRRSYRAWDYKSVAREVRDLGDEGFEKWIQACAIHPRLEWDWVVYLAVKLANQHQANAQDWLLLGMQLPWMQEGKMVKELRKVFLTYMPIELEMDIREDLNGFLKETDLGVVSKASYETKQLQKLNQKLQRKSSVQRVRRFRERIQTVPDVGLYSLEMNDLTRLKWGTLVTILLSYNKRKRKHKLRLIFRFLLWVLAGNAYDPTNSYLREAGRVPPNTYLVAGTTVNLVEHEGRSFFLPEPLEEGSITLDSARMLLRDPAAQLYWFDGDSTSLSRWLAANFPTTHIDKACLLEEDYFNGLCQLANGIAMFERYGNEVTLDETITGWLWSSTEIDTLPTAQERFQEALRAFTEEDQDLQRAALYNIGVCDFYDGRYERALGSFIAVAKKQEPYGLLATYAQVVTYIQSDQIEMAADPWTLVLEADSAQRQKLNHFDSVSQIMWRYEDAKSVPLFRFSSLQSNRTTLRADQSTVISATLYNDGGMVENEFYVDLVTSRGTPALVERQVQRVATDRRQQEFTFVLNSRRVMRADFRGNVKLRLTDLKGEILAESRPIVLQFVATSAQRLVDSTGREIDESLTKELIIDDDDLDHVYEIVEEAPAFPGGETAFYEYISKNLEYPKEALREKVEGSVNVEFTVSTDGSLNDIQVVKGIGFGCDEEAQRLIRNSPNWTPGRQGGKPVNVRVFWPVAFRLD